MKGSERHHLKDNELANLAIRLRRAAQEQKRGLGGTLIAIVVLGGAVLGYLAWQAREERRAATLMAAAVAVEEAPVGPQQGTGTPAPGLSFATERERQEAAAGRFKAVADDFPSTATGRLARHREGSIWLVLGRPKEAAAAFQQVADADSGLLGQTARLGLAEAHTLSGDYAQAIAAYEAAVARTDGRVPVEGILMQLARTYRNAGKVPEAEQTFTRVVEEFPASPLRAEAQHELDLLKQG
jgi:outer membrane protein assembly factor BamD (BamD/ComL family)